MPRRKADVVAGLENKGFLSREGDHTFLSYFDQAGRKTSVFTKVSHGSQNEIDDNLLGMMAKQCKLPKKRFFDLIDCPLDRVEYETILRENQHIRP